MHVETREEASRGANMSLSGSGYNVPIDMGLEATWGRRLNRDETITEMDDFVFAYRLHEIKYMFKVRPAVVYTGGDTEAADGGRAAPGQRQVERMEDVPIIGTDVVGTALVSDEDGMVE
ncbi:hypothetical protein QQS21_000486 [Conoideocrella luteorostrata]|uniref:Uncharacterized protein n=1 Tax=Conoideocrella luteorostrata TaxID=1105319 RepID=A0AAJ0CYZ2_9HYPO|nr:hypothetical protein QQS21_000486 [Conoideocrella luteorostrata]